MKKIAIAALAAEVLLTGCVAVPYDGGPGVYGNATIQVNDRDGHRGDRSRDRDHDGIPNRRDRDRDGDGVPNRQDSRPDNPTRY